MAKFQSFEEFQFFKELKMMSEIGFKYFKIPDPLDNVCEIATEMIFTKNISKIIKDTYPDVVVEAISLEHVRKLLNQMTIEKAKIIMNGKNILHLQYFAHHHVKTEKWFKT